MPDTIICIRGKRIKELNNKKKTTARTGWRIHQKMLKKNLKKLKEVRNEYSANYLWKPL